MRMKTIRMTVMMLVISLTSLAQDNEAVIEVQGGTEFRREVEKYQVEVSIFPGNYYGVDEYDKPTLEDLKQAFFVRLNEHGFAEGRFRESKNTKNYGLDYGEQGAVYVFDTEAESEFVGLIRLVNTRRLKGAQIVSRKVFYQSLANPDTIIAEALEDARKNAAAVAKAMGKRLGEVVSVADFNQATLERPGSYYAEEERAKYYLVAKFNLK